jgi:heptose-I-phosphate ethanolaminephosphotransferase
MKYPENQRSIIAAYDNSVRYTDWVINEAFKSFKDDEAIVFYFPDHGLDLFYTRPDYYLHAIASNPESFAAAAEIPFFVYSTEKFRSRFPDTITRIQNSVDHDFRTDDLIYTVMDISGISFEGNDDVKKYSLFSETY